MDTRHLEEFIDLAHSLSFTETAARLHVTQPTLSKHIAELEREFDAKLFQRTSSNVEMTEEGFYLLGVATDVVRAIEEAQAQIVAMREKAPVRIDGRFEDSLLSSVVALASSMCSIRGNAPVEFNHDKSKHTVELLETGAIDAFLDMLPSSFTERDDISSIPLFSRPVVAIVEEDHPLAGREEISVGDLSDQMFVQLLWEHYVKGWDTIAQFCAVRGFSPKSRSVTVRSLAEGLTVPLNGAVLIYPGASKELKHLHAMGRVALKIVDEDANFATHAVYLTENEERLAPFLSALQEASAIIRNEQ